jgi:8-oxo-dGTP diphosphatase
MPEATAAAIVSSWQSGSQRLLLTRRNVEPFKGCWCLPGGHIDRFEPARTAVIREVKEETGLDFDAVFFGYFDEIIPGLDIHAVVMAFYGVGAGSLSASPYEVTEAEWFSLDDARALPLAFTHNDILDAYADRVRSGENERD